MNRKEIIDLWHIVIHQKKEGLIETHESGIIIHLENNEYSIRSDNIDEVNVYKLDHMTFDTLMLQIKTLVCDFEIPYFIAFSDYKKAGSHYLIPEFKVEPIVQGFEELVIWLQENLDDFKLLWLDGNKPIIDNTNFVSNYKKTAHNKQLG